MTRVDQRLDSPKDIAPELQRFTRFERATALKRLGMFSRREAKKNPGQIAENRRRALKSTYFSVAQFWLGIATPIFIAACTMWSFRDSSLQIAVASVLTAIAAVPLSFVFVRWKQAREL